MIKLRPYQESAINKIAQNNGVLLVNAPQGSGKTFIPLFLKKKYPKLNRYLIVCPASVKYQWDSVIKTVFPESKSAVINGKYDTKYEDIIHTQDFVVINYDILFDKKQSESWSYILSNSNFQMLVIDESHKVGNQSSNRSQSVYDLSIRIPYRVMLTATPLTSDITGLWGQLHILDPLRFDKKSKFLNHFAPPVPKTITVKGVSKRVWKVGSVRHLTELQQLIQEYCYIISQDEVYKHLAGVQRIEVPCVIEDTSLLKKVYKLKTHDLNSEIELKQAKELLTTSRLDLGRQKSAIAANWIRDYLESTEEKIVVFAYHRVVVETLQQILGNIAVKFYGGMSAKEKEESKNKFINDESVRVIVMNIDACTGVDGLNVVSRTCFYAETTSLPSLFDQSEGRVRRTNSNYDAYFTYILKADLLDNAILNVMWERKKLFNSIMTGEQINNNLEDDAVEILKKLKQKNS